MNKYLRGIVNLLDIRHRLGEAQAMTRLYSAAKSSRGNIGWDTTPTTHNYELRVSNRILRARARDMCRNNGYGKNFLSIARKNIVGPKGIKLQARAKFLTGVLNTTLNDRVEAAFKDWGKRQYASVSGKLSWVEYQNLFVTQLFRDGEVLIRIKRGADNPYGFSMKFIDVSYLDETYNETLATGNRVLMSVEVDEDDVPVAYWLTTPASDYWVRQQARHNRIRVPASEMLHIFMIKEDESEARGLTWFHTALVESKDLYGYKFGVINSARTAAYAFGFLKPPESDGGGYDGTDDQNEPLNVQIDPLSINELPAGYEFSQFDPKQPTQNHAEFYKSILYDVAASLETNYTTLTGDLSDVNYSSIRAGKLDEQDLWKCLQVWMGERFCNEIYNIWLEEAVLAGGVELANPQQLANLRMPNWQPRGWSWVDPQKEVRAKIEALDNNLTTLTDELAAQGIDIEDHFKTIEKEREMAAKYGITLGAPEPEDEDPDEEKEPTGDNDQSYTNGQDGLSIEFN